MTDTVPTVGIILKGYPRLSETFIAQEIMALEGRGLAAEIISLRHPTDRAIHPVHEQIRAKVRYLPEYLYQEFGRVFSAWRRVRNIEGYKPARRIFLQDLRRDLTPNRVRRFGQALVLAAELPETIEQLYAHFLHTPSSVARYTSLLTGKPWSASAHAVDIWTTPRWDLEEKIEECEWITTCTRTNLEFLQGLTGKPDKITLVYHGIDVDRFSPPSAEFGSLRDGHDSDEPVVILSVGRAVEKKGYGDLLEALARLPHDLNWRFVHIGGGVLAARLQRQARRLGIESRIRWLGSQPQEKVISHYRVADIFALPCRIAENGDRDGLPNVLMEAQSQAIACVSTNVSAIPELILDQETGLLSDPGDIDALTKNLRRLIENPAYRRTLATGGERRVRERFGFANCFEGLAAKFGLAENFSAPKVA